MLERRHRSGVLDKKFALHRVIHDRILKQAQQELRNQGRLRPQTPLYCIVAPGVASKTNHLTGMKMD
jgi:hypothetical protein